MKIIAWVPKVYGPQTKQRSQESIYYRAKKMKMETDKKGLMLGSM